MSNYLDLFLFSIWPYLAVGIFFVEAIRRYVSQTYSYTSLSSQFLENKFHFWGLVPFHYGIIVTLVGHLIAFLFPRELLLWSSVPVRLVILEVTALIFGLLALVGLIHIIIRRMKYEKVRSVTSRMDGVLYGILLFMICSGLYVALTFRWGTSWFAAEVTPYLWSLVKLHPDPSYIINLPWAFKLHMVTAFLLIAVFPFTRLVHILVAPNHYFLRKRQVVCWNWNKESIRQIKG